MDGQRGNDFVVEIEDDQIFDAEDESKNKCYERIISKLRFPSIRQMKTITAIGCVGFLGGMHYFNQENGIQITKKDHGRLLRGFLDTVLHPMDAFNNSREQLALEKGWKFEKGATGDLEERDIWLNEQLETARTNDHQDLVAHIEKIIQENEAEMERSEHGWKRMKRKIQKHLPGNDL